MQKKVSIIVPFYNQNKYLDDCLASICNQTYKYLEIIVIDDGSFDGSEKTADAWEEKDSRLRVLHIANGGVSVARNRGIEVCTGDYIMFVDSDDVLKPHMVYELVMGAERECTDMAVCGIEEFCSEKEDAGRIHSYLEAGINQIEDYLKGLAKYNIDIYFGGPYCKLFSGELIRDKYLRFEKGENLGEDFMFNLQLLDYIKTIFVVQECLYRYRIDNADSISRKPKETNYFYGRLKKMYLRFGDVISGISADKRYEGKFLIRIIRMTLINITFDESIPSWKLKSKKMRDIREDLKMFHMGRGEDYLSSKEKVILFLFRHNFNYILLFIFQLTYRINKIRN